MNLELQMLIFSIAGIVPGARFDPFGPIDPFNNAPHRPNPNPDHLPPPGYDDMFL